LSLPEQIGGNHREVLCQRRHDVPPRPRAAGEAVHEQQHGPLARRSIDDRSPFSVIACGSIRSHSELAESTVIAA